MQNMDFYNGKSFRDTYQDFNKTDSEYFSRLSKSKDDMRIKKRASKIFFLIAAMCIISFTTGLAIGIKFAGGSERKIVDEKTFNAVKGIGTKMSNIFNKKSVEKFKNEQFPKEEYPYVIKVGNKFNYNKSQKIANYLSLNGHTVILSKKDNWYFIYTGPYHNYNEASNKLKKFNNYTKFLLASAARILKRH